MDSADHPPPMTSTPSDELKACPFCTSATGPRFTGTIGNRLARVICVTCSASGPPFQHKANAIAAWNRRPTSSRRSVLEEAIALALAESMKAPQSLDHPWDRGYRAGAAAVWSKLRALAEEN